METVMGMEQRFQEYFAALDRAGNKDRCYLCCRTPADVKRFLGFNEDGTPIAHPVTTGWVGVAGAHVI